MVDHAEKFDQLEITSRELIHILEVYSVALFTELYFELLKFENTNEELSHVDSDSSCSYFFIRHLTSPEFSDNWKNIHLAFIWTTKF